jgi:HK97 family phage prohead protease
MPKFILNDEKKVNSYGFVVLNSGANLARFNANPVMLNAHNPESVVGRWTNLQVNDDGQLTAEPLFDEEDADAAKIKGKVDRGFLKGASMGFIPLNMDYIVRDGVKILAVTEWELLEASTVSVPSNANCVRLYSTKGEPIPNTDIKLHLQQFTHKLETNNMSKILLAAAALAALGLSPETITDDAVSNAITKLAADKKTAEDALAASMENQATELVETALAAGKITADKKATFLALAKANLAQAKEILEAIPAKKQLAGTEQRRAGGVDTADRESWSFRDWQKKDAEGLKKLRVENFEAYEALRNAYGN